MNKTIKIMIGMLLVLSVFLSACGKKESSNDGGKTGSQEITVVLDWFPNTNHTGLYVAKEKGYFKDQGLKVRIIQPGENSSADQLVASGKADFGISYQENITQARTQGIPIKSIGAIIQHNTSGFASLKKDKIKTVKDFEGKRYGGWGAPSEEATLKAAMEKNGGDYSKVKNVTLGAVDFFKSIGRDADFEWIYYGWDGIEAERQGKEINFIPVKDLDPALDYYTPVIATSDKLAKNNPALAKKFMAATAKGYEYAIENPDEAADSLLKGAPELNKELVKKSQQWLSTQYQADAKQWGIQKKAVWNNYADWMYKRKLIQKKLDVKDAFTNEFLPKR
ncbi:ABC transporter substrate-binding protein [Priestia koreensis]|uniref:ABC transporter substrate-binding protein n=1 Tax=Priestia koreensis TaxID=284581 RepID=A0A0M0KRX0_9BACI|nr:ABC transporter substrate-binding protein [Priestia koreensis]KOO41143.1 ABC transporter substrate-binding protein [Priestia koreensis]